MRKETTESFIERSHAMHRGKYDYAMTNYLSNRKRVIIICPEHGRFEQLPTNHLRGNGCAKCSGKDPAHSKISFIDRSNKIHGDKYDYEKTIYISANQKVIITCPTHGNFSQTPATHIQGGGCKKCASEKTNKANTYTSDEFITQATSIHDNLYSYDKVEYINCGAKIIITCPLHGDFQQNPRNHLSGKGCVKCGILKNSDSCRTLQADFVTRANKIHSNYYSYAAVTYTGNNETVTITCPKHGDFLQTPHHHTAGSGCPKCRMSHGEREITFYLSEHKIAFCAQHKIPECKNKRPLPFDFAVFNDTKLIALIEYHGRQHYSKIPLWHRKAKSFEDSLCRDKIKFDYCNMNNIPLLIIPYYEKDHAVLLDTFLREL